MFCLFHRCRWNIQRKEKGNSHCFSLVSLIKTPQKVIVIMKIVKVVEFTCQYFPNFFVIVAFFYENLSTVFKWYCVISANICTQPRVASKFYPLPSEIPQWSTAMPSEIHFCKPRVHVIGSCPFPGTPTRHIPWDSKRWLASVLSSNAVSTVSCLPLWKSRSNHPPPTPPRGTYTFSNHPCFLLASIFQHDHM